MPRRATSWGFPRWGEYGKDREAVAVDMCEWEGCENRADCRAPKDRSLQEYWKFCAEHAAIYNKNWNYFAGMSAEDMEAEARAEQQESEGFAHAHTWRWSRAAMSKQDREREAALDVLDLDGTASPADIKAAYRRLAKRYHPDANPGDAEAEERFKAVCAAYDSLRN